MKLNVKYMIAAFALLGLVGCDKNFEEFETSGGGRLRLYADSLL